MSLRLWARHLIYGAIRPLAWHYMRDDMARSFCGLALPLTLSESWEKCHTDAPPKSGRVCGRCRKIVEGT